MSIIEVRTKVELEKAIENKVEKIIVKGELAEKIHKAEAIKSLSKPALIALGTAIAATPFTGGISGAVGVAAITATTGMSIVAITAVAFLGIALILSITNGYDRKFSAKADGIGEASMELNKK
jgi:hypothetical protein